MPFIFQLILTNSIPNRSEIDQIRYNSSSIRRIFASSSFFNFVIFFFLSLPSPFSRIEGSTIGIHD